MYCTCTQPEPSTRVVLAELVDDVHQTAAASRLMHFQNAFAVRPAPLETHFGAAHDETLEPHDGADAHRVARRRHDAHFWRLALRRCSAHELLVNRSRLSRRQAAQSQGVRE